MRANEHIRWSLFVVFEMTHLIVAVLSWTYDWNFLIWVTTFPIMVSGQALASCYWFVCGPTVAGFVVSLIVWATPYYWLGRYIEYRIKTRSAPDAPL